jgi:hypothetical protein
VTLDETHNTTSIVIPWRIEDATPESMAPLERWAKWIPGLVLSHHPGMTM